MDIKIIKDILGPFQNDQVTRQAIVTVDGKHFLASSSLVFGHGPETLIFPWDDEGNEVADWVQVAGEWHNGLVMRDQQSIIDIVRELLLNQPW